jgi:predicted DNA binding protein
MFFARVMVLEFLRLAVVHDDWSRFTESIDAFVDVASSIPIAGTGVKRSILVVSSPRLVEVKRLMGLVRGFRGVKSVGLVSRYAARNNVVAVLSTVRLFRGGVLSAVLNHGSYYYREFIQGGLEYWFVVTGDAGGLISELREHADVKVIEHVDALDAARRIGRVSLTRRELDVLKAAYDAGYFNWPRDYGVNFIAGRLGVSKTTLMQELRSVIRKLAERELNRWDYLV